MFWLFFASPLGGRRRRAINKTAQFHTIWKAVLYSSTREWAIATRGKKSVEVELMVFFFTQCRPTRRCRLYYTGRLVCVWLRSIFMFLSPLALFVFISGDLRLIRSSIRLSWLIENEKKNEMKRRKFFLLNDENVFWRFFSSFSSRWWLYGHEWAWLGGRRAESVSVGWQIENEKMKISSFSFIFSFDAQHDDKSWVECHIVVELFLPSRSTQHAHNSSHDTRTTHFCTMKWTSSLSSFSPLHSGCSTLDYSPLSSLIFPFHSANFKCFSHSSRGFLCVENFIVHFSHEWSYDTAENRRAHKKAHIHFLAWLGGEYEMEKCFGSERGWGQVDIMQEFSLSYPHALQRGSQCTPCHIFHFVQQPAKISEREKKFRHVWWRSRFSFSHFYYTLMMT